MCYRYILIIVYLGSGAWSSRAGQRQRQRAARAREQRERGTHWLVAFIYKVLHVAGAEGQSANRQELSIRAALRGLRSGCWCGLEHHGAVPQSIDDS
jgi:hypothetical protein